MKENLWEPFKSTGPDYPCWIFPRAWERIKCCRWHAKWNHPDPIGTNTAEDRQGKSAVTSSGYFGSKAGAGVWQTIINQIPPHGLWIEAFAGSAQITQRKRPAAAGVVIDADAAACEALRGTFAAMAGLTVINADAISWLVTHQADFNAQTVIYCDPPYLAATRSSRRQRYNSEMREYWSHGPLLEVLRRLKAKVLISHYRHELYDRLLCDWRRIDYQVMTHGGPRTESLWCNFPQPVELHEYTMLGQDCRARQDLKRKKARWIAKLEAMDALERAAVLGAIDDYRRCLTAEAPLVDGPPSRATTNASRDSSQL